MLKKYTARIYGNCKINKKVYSKSDAIANEKKNCSLLIVHGLLFFFLHLRQAIFAQYTTQTYTYSDRILSIINDRVYVCVCLDAFILFSL